MATRAFRTVLATAALALSTSAVAAADGAVNIYSARHYPQDEKLFSEFTERTGIEVNTLSGGSDALIQRIKTEGRNTPADVLVTVDAGRLWRAEQAGILSNVNSERLSERLPASVRHPEGAWFGFSRRMRLIFYSKEHYDAPPVTTYEGLADDKLAGEVCIRSSGNVYNQSLLASLIAHHGAEKAETWAAGVVDNFAREPQGGDTDQIAGVAAGVCGVAVANHYYYLRMLEKNPDLAEKVGVIFPNQDGRGVHANVSGAAVVKHGPNRQNAVRFLAFLASDFAQRYFPAGNNEYPVVADAGITEDLEAFKELGSVKIDDVNVALYGEHQPQAQKIFDRVGWK
ncbi:iron(III) transport system substrate-binding protein [Limimonas halophila]|uniref:Iron(III) transport system substrate-binding protein n=1 Tax=Limimonas halophila TaxID=1082479 RepID=A0A1G7M401_9PROT|nr:extracellular solute-binding protein [Limimonas halophila]SDF55910.1 iron(III) transport system substrate-binding protein [Limimonas halophila]